MKVPVFETLNRALSSNEENELLEVLLKLNRKNTELTNNIKSRIARQIQVNKDEAMPIKQYKYKSRINVDNLSEILNLDVFINVPSTNNLFSDFRNKAKKLLSNNSNVEEPQKAKNNKSSNNSKKSSNLLTGKLPSIPGGYMDSVPCRKRKKGNEEEEDSASYSNYQNSIYNINKKKKKKVNYNDEEDYDNDYYNRKKKYGKIPEEENEDEEEPSELGFKSAIMISNAVLNKNRKFKEVSPNNRKFVPPRPKNEKKDAPKSDNKLSALLPDNDLSAEKKQELEEKLKGFDEKMVEFISSEILSSSPNVSWSDIAGLSYAKSVINETLIMPLIRPDIFTGIRRPPRGVLLFGPPGTGKTMIAKAIASESRSKFFNISASSLMSKWIGDSEKLVRTLFALAAFYEPSVIFIDEIDSILTSRSENENEASRRIKTEFLVQLDGAGTSQKDRILIIGATNRPQEIDDAFLRRLSKKLYIPLPNKDSRKQLIQNVIKKENAKFSVSEEDIDEVVAATKGYSASDIINLCCEAAMIPIRSIHDIKTLDINNLRFINKDDFREAVRTVKSSVAPESIEQYIKWNVVFGSYPYNKEVEET